jgi:hypothetical protein
MTLPEVEAIVGHLDHDRMSDSDACREYALAWSRNAGAVYLMLEDGRVTRVSIFGGAYQLKTAAGIGIGSSEAAARAAYPSAEREGAPYGGEPAYDLYVWREPHRSGLRFEVDEHGVVTAMHGGGRSIQYMEGCL